MYLVTPEQMMKIESYCFETLQIPSLLLMEQAGSHVADYVVRNFGHENQILVLCGIGNNGGDGFVVARKLIDFGYDVEVILLGNSQVLKKDAAICYQYLTRFVKIHEVENEVDYKKVMTEKSFALIIDGLLGTGLNKPIDGLMKTIIEHINVYNAYKISIDIPTGVSGLTGKIMNVCLKSDLTITFGGYKRGHVLYPGKSASKAYLLKPIGIPEEAFQNNERDYVISESLIRTIDKVRNPRGHKGSFGKGLLIAGSPGMEGALMLSSRGALRSGLGLLYILTTPKINSTVKSKIPEAVSLLYKGTGIEEKITLLEGRDYQSVLIGPGLGLGNDTKDFLKYFLHKTFPIVIDADGLNELAKDMSLLYTKKSDVIMTPHIGEMSRLTGLTIESIEDDLIGVAKHYAKLWQVVIVLKSATTVVASPDGDVYVNILGNSGMATAGSGDVLAGVITGLSAQGYTSLEAALIGVYKHSKAGDKALKKKSEASMIASDLIDFLF